MTALTKFYTTALVAALTFSTASFADDHADHPKLLEAVNSDVRSEDNKARDKYRNPVETLAFLVFRMI